MATCPRCGESSRSDPKLMTLEPTGGLVAMPTGTYSLAGAQTKVAARDELRLSCRCGWSVTGYEDGGSLVEWPAGQTPETGGG